MKRVYVAVLSMGYIRKELAPLLFVMKNDPRYEVKITTHSLQPSEYNRNNIVKECIKEGFDFLFKIDHDNVPLKNPLNLVEMDLDVVGLPYLTVKGEDIGWLALKKAPDGKYQQVQPSGGLQEVDAHGDGVMLIARRVLEKVKVPFERKWEDGVPVLGSDFYFCEKAKELGFRIWTHWDYVASHYKELDLLQVLRMIGNASSR